MLIWLMLKSKQMCSNLQHIEYVQGELEIGNGEWLVTVQSHLEFEEGSLMIPYFVDLSL
jgi:hypothetical protein